MILPARSSGPPVSRIAKQLVLNDSAFERNARLSAHSWALRRHLNMAQPEASIRSVMCCARRLLYPHGCELDRQLQPVHSRCSIDRHVHATVLTTRPLLRQLGINAATAAAGLVPASAQAGAGCPRPKERPLQAQVVVAALSAISRRKQNCHPESL
jgi:hypothetical protein